MHSNTLKDPDLYRHHHNVYFSGANVILTTGGIDDLCLKYFVEAGAMAVRYIQSLLKQCCQSRSEFFPIEVFFLFITN